MSEVEQVNQQETSKKDPQRLHARQHTLQQHTYTHTTMNISNHPPKHPRTALTEQMFAQYLAGLLDADGHFSRTPQCVISFHESDRSLAFFIKTRIGYGHVRAVKDKRAINYICAHQQGLAYIAWLVQPHLRHPKRKEQLHTRVLCHGWCQKALDIYGKAFPSVSAFDSHWFAGFVEGDGSFQLKTSRDIRVMLQLDQKDRFLLDLVKEEFGGFLGFRQPTESFYYSSTSFGRAFALVKYFDRFQVIGRKRVDYVHWRKCVLLISQKKHLTEEGRAKILLLKSKLCMLRGGVEGTVPSLLRSKEFI